MRRLTCLLILGLCPLGLGCSVIYSTDDYRSDGGGGGDGSVDPGNLPSTPEISIDPAAPTTLDDLTVTITGESTDPMNMAVSYTFEWTRDGAGAVSGETVAAGDTSKGQVWEVTVTPSTPDNRVGTPAVASVTIANTPPALTYVGLDKYLVFEDEAVQAIPGPRTDADGDTVGVRYRWYLNDTLVDGLIVGNIDALSAIGAVADDQLRGEAVPFDDDEEGAAVPFGPLTIRPAVIAWRQLLPSRVQTDGGPISSFLDLKNNRILLLEGQSLWEYALDPGNERFVQLFPTGIAPNFTFPASVFDSRNDRVLLFGGQEDEGIPPNNRVFELDVSVRGGEAWRELPTAGDPPPGRLVPSMIYDEEGERIFVYGGFSFIDEGVFDGFPNLWVLDTSNPGSEAWSMVDNALTPGSKLGATWLMDRPRNRMLLIGGDDIVPPPDGLRPTTEVWVLNLETLEFTGPVTDLPEPTTLTNAFVDPADPDRAIVYHGAANGLFSEMPQTAMWELDLTDITFSPITPMGTPPPPSIINQHFYDPVNDRVVIRTGNVVSDQSSFSVWSYNPGAQTWAPIHEYGQDAPPSLQRAAATTRNDRDFIMTFGRASDRNDVGYGGVWRFAAITDDWQRLDPMPGMGDMSPLGRYGHAQPASNDFGDEVFIFGGQRDQSTALGDVWRLREPQNGMYGWERIASMNAPPARFDAVSSVTSCGNGIIVYGGTDTNGSQFADTQRMDCGGGTCIWERFDNPMVIAPPARTGASAFTAAASNDFRRRMYVFGGYRFSNGTHLNNVMSIDTCGSPGSEVWQAHTIGGMQAPMGRRDAVFVPVNMPNGAIDYALLFGGGEEFGTEMGDLWRLRFDGDGPVMWEPVTPLADVPAPSPRRQAVGVWDRDRVRMLVYGGRADFDPVGELWELRIRPVMP